MKKTREPKSSKRTTKRHAAESNPTAVSLFSGAGGLDIGIERAGFNVVGALDLDEDCTATLKLNKDRRLKIPGRHGVCYLQDAEILTAGVGEIDATDLSALTSGRPPDLLVGGPPCQPFSSAGKMLALHDPRGRLFEQFVRLADGLKPRCILFENVRGLVTAKGPNGVPGEALSIVRQAFEGIGYATTFALLNAADYGAHQRRVRLFMMAVRQGPLPLFPSPTHAEHPTHSLYEYRKAWVTLGDFLNVLPSPAEREVTRPTPALSALLRNVPPGAGLKSAGAREATRPGGHWGYRQGTFVADPSKPARTVTASATQDWIRDDKGLRRLTTEECAGLQGFPATWRFVGGKASVYRQIGNAVPVVFGQILGAALLKALECADHETVPQSAPWPTEFAVAVEYTKKELRRNGPSREAAKKILAQGTVPLHSIKGTGSGDHTPRQTRKKSTGLLFASLNDAE